MQLRTCDISLAHFPSVLDQFALSHCGSLLSGSVDIHAYDMHADISGMKALSATIPASTWHPGGLASHVLLQFGPPND